MFFGYFVLIPLVLTQVFVFVVYIELGNISNTSGQSVPIPRHSRTRAKNVDLVTLEFNLELLSLEIS